MSVTHSKVSAVADVDDTSFVRPSDWNDEHVVTGLPVNAADFDPAGDGVTLDQTALQNALDAVESGGILDLGGNGETYLVTGLILTNTGPVTIRGNGATIKHDVAEALDGTPIFEVRGARVTLEGIDWDGQRSSQPADEFADAFNTGGNGTGRAFRAAIMADGDTYTVNHLTVRDCNFRNIYGGCVATLDVPVVRVTGNDAEDCNFELAFIYSTTSQTDAFVLNNTFRDIGSAHASVNANGLLVHDYRRVHVSNNIGYNVERNFVKIEGGDVVRVSDNVCDTNTKTGFSALQCQNTVARLMVTDNNLYNVQQGITLMHTAGLTSLLVANNLIDTTADASAADAIIWGASTVTAARIEGNVLRNIKRHGISGGPGGGSVIVKDNYLHGQAASGQIALRFQISAAISVLELSGNVVENFQQASGAGTGMVTLEEVSGSVKIALLIFRDNTILSGSSSNRALRFVDDCVTAGIVQSNYIDGEAIFNSDGLIHRDNVITGTHTNTRAYAELPRLLTASKTWDPAETLDGATDSTTVTCTGAVVGDVVGVGFSVAVPAGALLVPAVTAANTVTVTLLNETGDTLDLGSGTLRVTCEQH